MVRQNGFPDGVVRAYQVSVEICSRLGCLPDGGMAIQATLSPLPAKETDRLFQ